MEQARIGLRRRHHHDIVQADMRRQVHAIGHQIGNIFAFQGRKSARCWSPWKRTIENSVSTAPGQICVTLML